MTKKYVPSGYQIINLNVELSGGSKTLTANDGDDAKILLDLLKDLTTNNILRKPILLKIYDVESDSSLCVFPSIRWVFEDYAYIECIFATASRYMVINYSDGEDEFTLSLGDI